jgi:hypothetical protein
MVIDTKHIGTVLEPVSMLIDQGRLAAFARATGGEATDVVPPTYLFAIELEAPDPFAWVAQLGVDMNTVLHGQQRFEYHRVATAGERLTASSVIDDIYSKRGGALEFIVKRTAVTDEAGLAVADLTNVVVVQNKGLS